MLTFFAMAAGLAATQTVSDSLRDYEDRVRFFSTMLHNNRDVWEKKINTELANGRHRIPLDLSEVDTASDSPGLSLKLLAEPVKYLLPWEEALLSFLRDINEKALRQLTQPLKLDVKGAFGRNYVTPRGMTAATLHNLMCVEGVVVKAGLVQPKLLQSQHVSKNSEEPRVVSRDQRDATAFENNPLAGAMPTHDAEGNELVLEVGLSVYKDYQKFTLQETPENSPCGQLPRNVEVVCETDLADKIKAGDRVQVIGVYKCSPPMAVDFTTGVFPSHIIATSINPIKEMLNPAFVVNDVTHIREIAARTDAFKLLARSFAPSICGHEKTKAGLLLQMIGGTEKNLSNGTHLRGDINVLLVGDPSCGKSQMLRFVMNTAPLALSTTGRGSSGVGLTAALSREQGSRDFNIEAGAMVLADRGVICIDEFDKMGQVDRVMIHEAMEQQCVTIAKAGLHVTLNARCSVTAAANPRYGTFEPSRTIMDNINMPDSLLSRFDLVFIVRDNTTEEIDRKIASQVVRQASLRLGSTEGRRRGVEQVHSSVMQRRAEEAEAGQRQEASQVFERSVPGPAGEQPPEVLTVDFLRKYIRFCKRLTPVLSEEAQAEVADKYVEMRMRYQSGFSDLSNPDEKRKPRLAVTTRTLEALIRLATAHAKLKLRRDYVLPEDVQEAYNLMLAAREENTPAPAVPPAAEDAAAAGDAATAQDPDGGRGTKRTRDAAAVGSTAGGMEEEAITAQRVTVLTTLVSRCFARRQEQQLPRAALLEEVNAGLEGGEVPFLAEEFEAGLTVLEARNKIFISEAGEVVNVS